MNYFSDTLTISLVIVLLFGSIALYLYTRIQQSEQKVSLLESILLDLKMSNEIKEYTELPASEFDNDLYANNTTESNVLNASTEVEYEALPDDADTNEADENDVNDTVNTVEVVEEVVVDVMDTDDSKVNYDVMNLKDLQTLAKSRGITGVTKKNALIEVLKTSEKTVKPGSNGVSVGSSSFLETSASFSNESL